VADWDYLTDFLVVGTGGGLAGAVAASTRGRQVLIIEKSDFVGGSTGVSGGVLWLPNNPLMQREGVEDSVDEALAHMDAVIGDVGPASSPARRRTYVEKGIELVDQLESLGVRFVRAEGYSDYYEGYPGIPGGKARGRAIEGIPWDGRRLGPWEAKLRPSIAGGMTMLTGDVGTLMQLRVHPKGIARALKVAARTAVGRVRRQHLLTNGASLTGQLLGVLLRTQIPVWTGTLLTDLVVEDGAVTGVVVEREGRTMRIRARDGVLLATGGFAKNQEMRDRYSRQPSRSDWSISPETDTGEVIELAIAHGAQTALMEEAWWIPTAVAPGGHAAPIMGERSKPHSIIVDAGGERYFNEAAPQTEAGRAMYARQQEPGGAIPSWLIIDSHHRSRYLFLRTPPGRTPEALVTSGFLKRADTLEDLARQCGIDPAGLAKTVERFNGFARTGVDEDFHRGQGAHDRYQGDWSYKRNASLGEISKGPFYAVALYPGDVGTSGGLLTDEHARVLRADGQPIAGLYAAGNCTAAVMGRAYLGPGASIGSSHVFSFVAGQHASERAADRDPTAPAGV
jgi:3-oxosteroid 1-dehydrogenase